MHGSHSGGGGAGRRRSADGGREHVSAGSDPPSPPSDAASLFDRYVDGPPGEAVLVIRIALDAANDEYADRVEQELRTELTVHGTTRGDECDPDREDCFDVVVSTEYPPSTVVDALVEPPEVAAASAVGVEPAGPSAGEADDDAVSRAVEDLAAGGDAPADDGGSDGDGEPVEPAMAGVEADAEFAGDGDAEAAGEAATAAEGQAAAASDEPAPDEEFEVIEVPGEADPDASSVTDGASGDSGAADGPDRAAAGVERARNDDVSGERTDDEAGGAAAGSHPAFEQFKMETDPVDYDDLVEELDAMEMPGEFEDDVDLEPILERGPGPDAEASDTEVQRVTDGNGATQVRASASEGTTPQSVVESLVAAIEQDALTAEQRRTIAEALDDGPPKTLMVRIEHLQREVDELAAYKESLETFIDEYGSGEPLVDQVRAAMEEFWADVQEVEADVSSLRGDLEETGDRLDDVERRVESADERVADLDELETRVAAMEELESRVGSLRTEFESLREQVEEGAGSAVADRLDDVADRLDDIEATVSTVEADTAETAERLADLEDRLAEQEAWRERIQDVMLSGSEPSP